MTLPKIISITTNIFYFNISLHLIFKTYLILTSQEKYDYFNCLLSYFHSESHTHMFFFTNVDIGNTTYSIIKANKRHSQESTTRYYFFIWMPSHPLRFKFDWSHFRISFTDSKAGTTLDDSMFDSRNVLNESRQSEATYANWNTSTVYLGISTTTKHRSRRLACSSKQS